MTKAEKERAWASRIKRVYGITAEQYYAILLKQHGGCGVCGKTPEEEGRRLAVEHDHHTREILGVCCMRCNRQLLGRIRNPELYEKAAAYLRQGTGLFVPPKKRKRCGKTS